MGYEDEEVDIDNIETDKDYQPQQEKEGVEHSIDFSEVIEFGMRFNLSTFVVSAFTNLVAKGRVIPEGIFLLVSSNNRINLRIMNSYLLMYDFLG